MNPDDPMGQMMGGMPDDALGNRTTAPRRAIDKLLMTQQQTQPRSMAFPMGMPLDQQQQPNPNASTFLNAILR